MAVSQMQRAQIFAHSSHRAQLIRDLQNLEIIHIVSLNEQEETAGEIPSLPESGETSVLEEEIRGIIRGIQGDLSHLQSTIDYLADFEQKKGFISSLLGSRVVISSQEYSQLSKEIAHGEWRGICSECRALEDQTLNLTSREGRLKSDRENLRIWSNLDVPIEEIRDTEKTAIRIGVVPVTAYDGLLAEANSSGVDVALEIIGQTKTEIYVVVIFLQEDEQEVTPILNKYGFSLASLPLTSGTVADRLKQIEDEFSQISAQRQEIAEKSTQLAVHRDNLMAVYDHISELLRQEQVRESFINTDHAFMIEGWVRKKDTKKLEEAFSGKYDEVEVIFSEPSEDDEPPVDLQIKGPADPFQMVTRLYGIFCFLLWYMSYRCRLWLSGGVDSIFRRQEIIRRRQEPFQASNLCWICNYNSR
jgi:V/A-type H+-transporting ATPase subunit I